jgi:hypothetical protein
MLKDSCAFKDFNSHNWPLFSIAIFLYMLHEVGNQNIVGCLQQFTFIFSLYQIWLKLHMDHYHFGYTQNWQKNIGHQNLGRISIVPSLGNP